MKYERITSRNEEPFYAFDACKECEQKDGCDKWCAHTVGAYMRLHELEDKIEHGEIDYVSDRDKEIARLTAENQRLREEAAEQKSIAAHEHATQMEWFGVACDYKAENAELRARLEKAVELPCVKAVKTKEWVDKVEVGDTIWEWAVVYIDRQGEFVVEPCRSKTAAEIKFKKLKGDIE